MPHLTIIPLLKLENFVQAAAAAFPSWSRLSYEQRGKYLFKIADAIDARLDELSLLESQDQGTFCHRKNII